MKSYILEIYALDPYQHLFVIDRSYCDDLPECFEKYNFFLFSVKQVQVCDCHVVGYHIYQSYQSSYPGDFVCFEDDFILNVHPN